MVLFLDGASHYATAQLGQKWTTLTSDKVTWDVVVEGRVDGCIRRTSTQAGDLSGQLAFSPLMTQTGPWSQTASGIFSCALKIDDLNTINPAPSGNSFEIWDTFLSVMNGVWTMFAVVLNTNGTFSIYTKQAVGGVNVLRATSLTGIASGAYAFIEIKWVISSGTGSVIIRSNGTEILNYAGIVYPSPFPFTPPAQLWNSIKVLGMESTPNPPGFLVARMCDVFLQDLNAPNGDFLGDHNIAYIKPDGIGAQSGWTPFPGAPNFSKVNEVPPDDDTTYVATTPAGTRDTYTFEDVLGDPVAIQVCTFCRKTGVGGASIAVITRPAGVDFDGPVQAVADTTYDYILQPYDTNPATSAPWTKAEMDAGEWGPLKSV